MCAGQEERAICPEDEFCIKYFKPPKPQIYMFCIKVIILPLDELKAFINVSDISAYHKEGNIVLKLKLTWSPR